MNRAAIYSCVQLPRLQESQTSVSRSANVRVVSVVNLSKGISYVVCFASLAIALPCRAEPSPAHKPDPGTQAPHCCVAGSGSVGVGVAPLAKQELNKVNRGSVEFLAPVVGKGEAVPSPKTEQKAQSRPSGGGKEADQVVGEVHITPETQAWLMLAAAVAVAGCAIGLDLPRPCCVCNGRGSYRKPYSSERVPCDKCSAPDVDKQGGAA